MNQAAQISAEANRVVDECVDDLRMAVVALIRQRTGWAQLATQQREQLKADMDRLDRAILMASVERVVCSVAMFARIEVAKERGATA